MKLIVIISILMAASFDDPVHITYLEKKAENNPGDWQSRLELTEIFLDQGNFDEAKRNLTEVQNLVNSGKLDTCNAEYLFLCGLYYDLKVNISAALKYYDRTVNCDPGFIRAWRNQAYLYEIFGNYSEMLYCFNQALINTADSAGIYYDLGVTYDYLDSLNRALDSYYTALTLGETYPQIYLNMGVDWGMLGFDDSASYYFEMAKQAGLRSPELYYNIGVIMFESGAYEEAMENFMQTLAVDPEYVPAKLQVGNVFEIQGDSGMAKAYYEEFVKTAPIIYSDDIKAVEKKLEKLNR